MGAVICTSRKSRGWGDSIIPSGMNVLKGRGGVSWGWGRNDSRLRMGKSLNLRLEGRNQILIFQIERIKNI